MSSATQLLLPADHQSEEISTGTAGTAQTIERMRQLAQRGKRSALYRETLGKLVRKCKQKDYKCYAKAVHDFCTNEIHYVHDPVDVEYVESPEHVLRAGIADCDSKCILFAALCENMGMPVQFVTVRGNPMSPEFTHVYCRVNIPGVGWTASDTTMPNKPFGWEPKGLPEKVWPVSEGAQPEMGMLLCESEGLGEMDGGVVAMQGRVVGMSGMDGPFDFITNAFGGSADTVVALENIINGSTYQELASAKQTSNNLSILVGSLLNKANQMTDANMREAAMQQYARAQSAVTKERGSLLNAINIYNKLAQDIATYSVGAYKPQQLGNPALIALASVGVIAAGVVAFQKAMSIWRDDTGKASQLAREQLAFQAAATGIVAASKGINTATVYDGVNSVFESLSPKFKATEVLDKFGTYAAVGGGIFLLVMIVKKFRGGR